MHTEFHGGKKKIQLSPAFTVATIVLVFISAFAGGYLAVLWLPERPKTMDASRQSLYSRAHSVPPNWIGYVMTGCLPVPIDLATCLAVSPDGSFAVGGDTFVLLYSFPERLLKIKIELDSTPTCLAFLDAETLLIGKKDSLDIYGVNGKLKATWRENFLSDAWISGISATKESIFIADSGNKIVYSLDYEGNLKQIIGFRRDIEVYGKTLFPGFVVYAAPAMNILVSPDGERLHISNPGKHRIESFTTNGDWVDEESWGSPSANFMGFSGCCNPVSLSVLSDGMIVTAEHHIPRIKVYRPNGALLCVIADSQSLLRSPRSGLVKKVAPGMFHRVAVLSNDDIAVLDPFFGAVRFFTKKTGAIHALQKKP